MVRRIYWLCVLLAFPLSLARASTEQWLEVSSNRFTVLSNSNEKQARHVLDQFERMRWMFQVLFPRASIDPSTPMVIFAAKNEKTFQSVEPESYLAKGQLHLAGLFLRAPDKNYVLLRLDADEEHPFATIYHEYTHMQFSSISEWVPLWLNEGIAEFFQNTDIHEKDVSIGEPNAMDILYLRQNRLIPLPTLFKIDATSPDRK